MANGFHLACVTAFSRVATRWLRWLVGSVRGVAARPGGDGADGFKARKNMTRPENRVRAHRVFFASYSPRRCARLRRSISPPPTRRAALTARLTRLLLSRDLLRVAGWSCLGSGSQLSLFI